MHVNGYFVLLPLVVKHDTSKLQKAFLLRFEVALHAK